MEWGKIVTVTTRGHYWSLFWAPLVQCTPKYSVTHWTCREGTKRQYRCICVQYKLVARWVGWSRPHPDNFLLGEDPTISIVEEAGWAPWVWRWEILLSLLGFELWTAQIVASCFTDSAVPATVSWKLLLTLSSHSCLGLPSIRPLPVSVRSKILCEIFISPLPTSSSFILIAIESFGMVYTLKCCATLEPEAYTIKIHIWSFF
jgi:hypothetical protein